MIWEAIATKLGIDSILGTFRASKKKYSERQYRQYLADAVAELLVLDPNINEAEAKIRAAEALDLPPSAELITARDTLEKVRSYRQTKKKSAKKGRKFSRKKKARKSVPRKRRVKRKAAKKTIRRYRKSSG